MSLEDYYTDSSDSSFNSDNSTSSCSSSSPSSSKSRRSSRSSRDVRSSSCAKANEEPVSYTYKNPSNIQIVLIRNNNTEKDVTIHIKKINKRFSTVSVRDRQIFGENFDTFNLRRFDTYRYVSNLLDMVRTDFDDSKSSYKEIQFFIPLFPAIIIPVKFTNREYNTVMSAINFYTKNF